MTVNILAFGIVKELFGSSSIAIELPDAATTSALVNAIKDKYPDIKKLKSFAVAINGTYAADDMNISPTDEIAIIPPVSGG